MVMLSTLAVSKEFEGSQMLMSTFETKIGLNVRL